MGRDLRNRFKEIQLPQLRSFCLAAAEESFSAAASALGISVSAVWQQVRGLEKKLGTPLLQRRGREVQLTSSGRLLLDLAQPHVNGLDTLPQMFGIRRAGLSEPLHVVATAQVLLHTLPDPLKAFTLAHPKARIHLRSCRWQEILDLVERGEADLGLTPWDRSAPPRSGLEYEPMFEHPFLLLTGANHPLRRKRLVRARDLLEHPLIVQTKDTCDHQVLVRRLHQDDLTLDQYQVTLVSPSVDMTFRYVALGVGIALAHVDPKTCKLYPDVHGRIFDKSMKSLPFGLVVRKNAYRSTLAEEFCKMLRRFLGR